MLVYRDKIGVSQESTGRAVTPDAWQPPTGETKLSTLVDKLVIVRPDALEICLDLIVVLAHMRGIPAVTPGVIIRERGSLALECRVGGAQHGLSHVGDAVDHVPMVVLGDLMTGRQT